MQAAPPSFQTTVIATNIVKKHWDIVLAFFIFILITLISMFYIHHDDLSLGVKNTWTRAFIYGGLIGGSVALNVLFAGMFMKKNADLSKMKSWVMRNYSNAT